MATLPDNSVDLILTDPPYYRVKGDWWDRQWDSRAGFLAWLDTVLEQFHRILKPNGSLYMFASPRMSAHVEVLIGERFNVLENITWVKPDPSCSLNHGAGRGGQCSKETLRSWFPRTEEVIFAEHYGADNIAKGEAGYEAKCDELRGFVFEPLRAWFIATWDASGLSRATVDTACGCSNVTQYWFLERNYQIPTAERYAVLQRLAPAAFTREYEDLRREYEELRREYEDLRREYEDLRRPFAVTADVPYTDTWTFPTVQAYRGKHVCEKPLAMLEHIITASSKPGAVVLDAFAGSGATLEAAKNLGRNYIGIEIDEHWAALAQQRCAPEQAGLFAETA